MNPGNIVLSADEMERMYDTATALVDEIEKVVVGKRAEIKLLVTALLAGGHVLIEDVPGVGKTTLASAAAKAAGLAFRRAQFTPDVMASDITGFNIYNRQSERFEFKEGLVMTNILLADEINRASPKTQSSLLEAMEESRVTVDGVTYEIPDPFMVIATQNPTGFVGTYPLPEAQIDRFSLKISMGYPSLDEEIAIIESRRTENPIDTVKPVTGVEGILALRNIVSGIHIDPEVSRYIVLLVTATRRHEKLALGASPRASLALMHIAQAYAFMHRRVYVLPDDVAAVYRSAIAHRLILRQEAKLDNITAESVLTEILRRTDVPYKGKREKTIGN